MPSAPGYGKAGVVVAIVLGSLAARAAGPPPSAPAPIVAAPPVIAAPPVAAPAPAPSPPVAKLLAEALARFDAGDYDGVVQLLQSKLLEDRVDRAQELRLLGISCALTGRSLPAEAAFTAWLELDPRARLDPELVRPDVVSFFDQVRDRHKKKRLAELERRRPRSVILNLLPPAGQFQNGQRRKFAGLLATELALLVINIASGAALYETVRPDKTFPNPDRAEGLQITNWVSFGGLMAVLVYGAIDGFVVGRRIRRALDRDEASLLAAAGLVRF